MKLFLISDIHGNDNFDPIKDKLAEADLVLCAGDFTMFLPTEEGLRVAVLDTRKTTPGLRYLEKEAVAMGGGMNHRIGLFDMILSADRP